MTTGEVLKAAREGKKISQGALARLTGISSAQISRLETGDRGDAKLATIAVIADALGISIDALARGELLWRVDGVSMLPKFSEAAQHSPARRSLQDQVDDLRNELADQLDRFAGAMELIAHHLALPADEAERLRNVLRSRAS